MGNAEIEVPFEHFESLEQQRDAARVGIWLFLATETLLFGAIFTSFGLYHRLFPDAFSAASRSLAWELEAWNTVVLLSSGFTMALCDHYAAELKRGKVILTLGLTILLGLTFLVLKGVEYRGDYVDGQVPFLPGGWHYSGPDPSHAALFFNFYFLLTGLHAAHMVIGISLLSILFVRAIRWRSRFRVRSMLVGVGLFWAFIDVVWLFIYSSLYLINRPGGA
jgi:cytochrome c oxidase subunit 3